MSRKTEDVKSLVTAPVIVNAMTAEGVQPLLDYIASLAAHDVAEISAAETARLNPYFTAMGRFMARTLQGAKETGAEKKKLKSLVSPRALCTIFNAMAQDQKAVLISDVLVMPNDIRKRGPAKHLFQNTKFNFPYFHNYAELSFGFMQALKRDADGIAVSATVLPTFFVDSDRLATLRPATAEKLLQGIKAAMTFVNHDPLHHFTLPLIHHEIISRLKNSYDDTAAFYMDSWAHRETKRGHYEPWAHIGHEHILLLPENAALVVKLRDQVGAFFDVLDGVAAETITDGSKRSRMIAHDAVDYFGTVMLHALSRVFPLNHEIMAQAIGRLEKADPLPAQTLLDLPKPAYRLKKTFLDRMMQNFDNAKKVEATADLYSHLDFEMRPEHYADLDYKKAKLLQLVRLGRMTEDINAHIPSTEHGPQAKVRANIKQSMLGMIRAAAKDAKVN